MSALPLPEMIIFVFVIGVYLIAAVAGVFQLWTGGGKCSRLLQPLVCLAISAQALLLVFRAVAIKAVPLTGLFESMIVLTIVFGLIYLLLSVAIQQVWFGSVMLWIILAMVLLTAAVAEPATEPHEAAATPWAISHAIAMILGGSAIAFSTACAILYLLGIRKLKKKNLVQVLGKVPNIEKLENMTTLGLKACFVLITFGLASGIGLAAVKSTALGIGFLDWITDAKIVLITAAWMLLGAILVLRSVAALKGRTIAYMVIVTFVLILFAIIGTTVFCRTKHDFTKTDYDIVQVRETTVK
jgi:ABC-type uncharacterized transport system permease subunit